ncbi:hypothetical protein [Allosalinactinospora lopnorensis]|uniref:hypothetical protein n=1 Tax=Allosalinactinospora lopnorensis TaxID=1352348 RepID=UPI000623E83B|nr:hypothetical protein [Allosalinactinospora lopnorensis]
MTDGQWALLAPLLPAAGSTGGLLLAVVITTASLQDRDGAFRITAAPREAFSTITLVWADAGYT